MLVRVRRLVQVRRVVKTYDCSGYYGGLLGLLELIVRVIRGKNLLGVLRGY